MNITHEEFKEQVERIKHKQKIADEKESYKREQEIREFYQKELRNIEKAHISQITKLSSEYQKELQEENSKKVKKHKETLQEKNQIIQQLKQEIRRLRERNKKIEKSHTITQSLRSMLLITIDRLEQYDSVLTSSQLSIFQSLSKMKHELDYTITKIKSKEDLINEIMLPEEQSIDEGLEEKTL